MPTIAFVSPKGGAGKTTAAVILATTLAEKRAAVSIIDADPNQPVTSWSKFGLVPKTLSVIPHGGGVSIIDAIEDAASKTAFVIVDLEGTASMTVAHAIGRADLVIIPTQGSQLDGKQAARAVKLVQEQEKAFRRPIPYAVLLTRTSVAIQPKTLRHIRTQFEGQGVTIFKTQLLEREAFRAIFSFGGTLHGLDRKTVSNVDGAIGNAGAFVAEAIERIKQAEKATGKEGKVA